MATFYTQKSTSLSHNGFLQKSVQPLFSAIIQKQGGVCDQISHLVGYLIGENNLECPSLSSADFIDFLYCQI